MCRGERETRIRARDKPFNFLVAAAKEERLILSAVVCCLRE